MLEAVGNAEHLLGDRVMVDQAERGVDHDDPLLDRIEHRLQKTVFARQQMDIGVDAGRVHRVQLGSEFAEEILSGHC